MQLRSKEASTRDLFDLAAFVQTEIQREGADTLLFVNDRFDVGVAVGAHGVHVGPDDLPVDRIRAAVPKNFLIGASADDPGVASLLASQGADYVGCGTVFATRTKADTGPHIGVDGLARVVTATRAPVVGIGGITLRNLPQVMTSGCAGVALLSGIMGAADPGEVVRSILSALP